jgi:hypothetical protein
MTRIPLTIRRPWPLVAFVVLAVSITGCSSPADVTSDGGDSGASKSDSLGSNTNGADPVAVDPGPADAAPASGGDVVAPSAIVGVWSASDGSGTKVIDGSGQCSGMYWNNGIPLDIGGPMHCALGSQQASDGSYTLVVQQPPNQANYAVAFHGYSFNLVSGGVSITLTRQ